MYLGGIGVRADRTPLDLALTDGSTTLSWEQLSAQVVGVAAGLHDLVGDDDARIGVTGENTAQTLISHVAGLLSGVGTVALHRQATPAEFEHELLEADCAALVTGPAALASALAAARSVRNTKLITYAPEIADGSISWGALAASAPTGFDLATRPVRPVMVYTSGTTGRAKATEVSWTSGEPPSTAQAYVERLSASSGFPEGVHLVVGPLQHNGPLTSVRHLLSGQPVVVMPRFDAGAALQLIERFRVTSCVMVPTHFSRLLAVPEQVRSRCDVSSLELVAHTGSACPPDVKRAMIAWFGPVLSESYGGSELGTVCRISSADWLTHPGSVGRAVAPMVVSAFDESGVALADGEVGLLGVRLPPGRQVRFHRDAEKSKRAYLAPDVVTLGDVGYVDADGFVYITDRLADIVVSGGVNLYPAESEAVLTKHPGVREVAVIGIPDKDMGESLHALVVSAEPDLDLEQLARLCRHDLAGYKCPRSYEIVAELSRNEMGKINKRALRVPYWGSDRTIGG